jgi:hypothetical protein
MAFTPPPGHACYGHDCDGCISCRSGICCLSAPKTEYSGNSDHDGLTILREAMQADAFQRPRLLDLLQADILTKLLEGPDFLVASEITGNPWAKGVSNQSVLPRGEPLALSSATGTTFITNNRQEHHNVQSRPEEWK